MSVGLLLSHITYHMAWDFQPVGRSTGREIEQLRTTKPFQNWHELFRTQSICDWTKRAVHSIIIVFLHLGHSSWMSLRRSVSHTLKVFLAPTILVANSCLQQLTNEVALRWFRPVSFQCNILYQHYPAPADVMAVGAGVVALPLQLVCCTTQEHLMKRNNHFRVRDNSIAEADSISASFGTFGTGRCDTETRPKKCFRP